MEGSVLGIDVRSRDRRSGSLSLGRRFVGLAVRQSHYRGLGDYRMDVGIDAPSRIEALL